MHIPPYPGPPAHLRSSGAWAFPFVTRGRRPLHGNFTDRCPANPPWPDGVLPLMDPNLPSKFARIGARLKVADRPTRCSGTAGVISLDVHWGWRTMRRNPGVYVRGRVRHADRATITLHGWHRVVMNTEGQSKAMRNLAFLD